MPTISSANPDFKANAQRTTAPIYRHGAEERRSFVPMAFQVTSPFTPKLALLPHALVLHVNPQNLSESHNKKVERFQTRGGFVEQHWGDDLSDLSADGVTGAFMNIYTGLSSLMRQKTIAWDRFQDLKDLYRHNGSVFDPLGNVVLQGKIMVMYDRGTYFGHFKTFEVEETDESPFMFRLNWTFKVEETILQIPFYAGGIGGGPSFQSENRTAPAPPISTKSAGAPRASRGINPLTDESGLGTASPIQTR